MSIGIRIGLGMNQRRSYGASAGGASGIKGNDNRLTLLTDQTATNTTSFQLPSALKKAASANSFYSIRGNLFYTAEDAASPNMEIGFYGPTGSSAYRSNMRFEAGPDIFSGTAVAPTFNSASAAADSGTDVYVATLTALILVTSTTGDIGVHWRPSASNALGLTLLKGSHVVIEGGPF